MNISKLSVHNFVADIVRIINNNFTEITEEIKSFFDSSSNTLKATNINITGKVEANSVYAKNITVILDNGKKVTMNEIIKRIEDLEKK